jgi:N-methylhydantoinase A
VVHQRHRPQRLRHGRLRLGRLENHRRGRLQRGRQSRYPLAELGGQLRLLADERRHDHIDRRTVGGDLRLAGAIGGRRAIGGQTIASGLRLAVDIGGTFTDVAAFDDTTGALAIGKTLSTPARLVDGINAGVDKAGTDYASAGLFLHGSTIAVNTILERTGARTALITTEGFRDVYEIGRINRPDSYNLFFQKHQPLVERALRFEIAERVLADGEVLVALDEAAVETLGERLTRLGIEATAILFLHCYKNPAHEARAKAILAARCPAMFVSASHELSQEYREFERCSTVVANAYIGPRVRRYLGEIDAHLRSAGFDGSFLVVQSTGGLYEADQARSSCVRMLESGPAAGVIGTQALCHALGRDNAIAFDMGGTTAKAGVIHMGEALTTGAALLGGYDQALPVQIAMMHIFEVGTGGGSIARVEDGALRVGPQSAGARPGPACYGLGGREPTVTDANLVLGRLHADRFLGGEMRLHAAAAEAALRSRVAAPLGLDVIAAADGILRIAATAMSYAVKGVTTDRGLDVGDFALVAYGGAGPLHAADVARELGIRTVIVPDAPGVFSAVGMLSADLRHDFVRTWVVRLEDAPFDELERIYGAMEADGRRAIAGTSVTPRAITVKRAADMRYVGQEHAVTVDLPLELFVAADRAGIKRRFDAMHELRYGTSAPEERAEIVSLRSTVAGALSKPPRTTIEAGDVRPVATASTGTRPVYFREAGGFVDTPTYARAALLAGNRIEGPALVEEHASTTVLGPDDTLEVDGFGDLVIAVAGRR